jgi:hypothetical protein
MNYIIGTGWWADHTRQHAGSLQNTSSDLTRDRKFFDLWYYHINKYSNPSKIIVTDSCSPIKPDLTNKKVEFVSLLKNFKPARICEGMISGWTRSVLNGAFYSIMNDADYYIYIEQDCLIFGKDIIEKAIENLGDSHFSFGYFNHSLKIEQSFIVIKKEAVLTFINLYLSISKPDSELRPEHKFDLIIKSNNLLFKELPFGYGRNRPFNVNDLHFYIQHITNEELNLLTKKENTEDIIFDKIKEKF